MSISLAPVAFVGDPGIQIQLTVSPSPDLRTGYISSVDVRRYGIAFLSEAENEDDAVYLYLVPWSNVILVASSSNGVAFDFDELRFSESGANVTLTLVDASTIDCTAIEVREYGVLYNDGTDPAPIFRPWHEIAALSQATS
jgi:hypothetical protein